MKRFSILSLMIILMFAFSGTAFSQYSFDDGSIVYVFDENDWPDPITTAITPSPYTHHTIQATAEGGTYMTNDYEFGARTKVHIVSQLSMTPDHPAIVFHGTNWDIVESDTWTCRDILSGSYYSIEAFLLSVDDFPPYGGYAEATIHIEND